MTFDELCADVKKMVNEYSRPVECIVLTGKKYTKSSTELLYSVHCSLSRQVYTTPEIELAHRFIKGTMGAK